jgi:hypothetical protein
MATGASKAPDSAAAYTALNKADQRANSNSRFIFTSRPAGSDDRIIIPFLPMAGCSSSTGFSGQDRLRAPARLAALGVTDPEWKRFAEQLESEVQPLNPGGFCKLLLLVLLFPAPLIFTMEGRYHMALGRWLDDLNAQVLCPRGLFGKFQTTQANGNSYHEEQSWLAISVTAEDADKLRAEPVFWRPACCSTTKLVADDCQTKTCCCCGCRYTRVV